MPSIIIAKGECLVKSLPLKNRNATYDEHNEPMRIANRKIKDHAPANSVIRAAFATSKSNVKTGQSVSALAEHILCDTLLPVFLLFSP